MDVGSGEWGCNNSRMIITGQFQPSLLTRNDWSKGNTQDFHGLPGVASSSLQRINLETPSSEKNAVYYHTLLNLKLPLSFSYDVCIVNIVT